MITVVRHNNTALNGESGDDYMRGWLNLALSKTGRENSLITADKLHSLGLNFDSFHTSSLKRARQTSDSISDKIDMKPEVTDNLKDWNIGEFEGKKVKDVLSQVHNYLDSPDKTIPEGESYNTFKERVTPFVTKLVEDDKNHLIVTHNRVVTLLHALSKGEGKEPDIDTLKDKGPIDPGGIMTIDPDWNMTKIFKGINV